MTPDAGSTPPDTGYPDNWKDRETRRREHEAGREVMERYGQMTSGCGGHLGPSPLVPTDDYPSAWRAGLNRKENDR